MLDFTFWPGEGICCTLFVSCNVERVENGAVHILANLLLERGTVVLKRPEVVSNALYNEFAQDAARMNILLASLRWGIPMQILSIPVEKGQEEATYQALARELAENAGRHQPMVSWAVQIWVAAISLYRQQALAPEEPEQQANLHWRNLWQRLQSNLLSYFQQVREDGQLYVARLQKHGLLYAIFVIYAVLFTLFVGGLMGFMFGFVVGAIISFFAGLNMYAWFISTAVLGSLAGIFFGMTAFFNDFRQKDRFDKVAPGSAPHRKT